MMPPFADTDTEYSPSSTCDYTLLDVMIDTIFGCDNRNTANDDEQPNTTSPSTSPQQQQQLSTNSSEDERGSNWSGSRYYNYNNYPQEQPNNSSQQSLNKNRRRSISRSNSTGSLQTSSNSFDKNNGSTIILPHLRFNPLSGSSSSSFDDFCTLFLADDALNSFSKFHTSIGDCNISCTPWESAPNDNINCIEREIKFITLISPGSSSNPLTSSNQSVDNNNGTSIPLGVTIHQSLIQQQSQPTSTSTTQQPNSNKCWKLTCNFSFDITPQTTLPKFGAYLMSSVVKGTIVTVSVTLSECDEGNIEWIDMSSINKKPGVGRNGNKKGGATRRSISDSSGVRRRSNSENSNDDGLLSACFSHPLLLPPEGLCSTSSAYNKSSSKQGRTILNKGNFNNRQRVNIDEPAQVGASLLSAIKAKNSTDTDVDVGCSYGSLAISHIFDKLPSCSEDTTMNMSKLPSKPTTKARRSKSEGYKDQQQDEDVLSSYNSRGTLKMKHMPSYEVSKSLSNISMRSMILDKKTIGNTTAITPSTTTPFENTTSRSAASGSSSSTLNLPVEPTSLSKGITPSNMSTASPTSVSSKPQGLSMRIEMELNGESSSSSNNNNPQNPIPLTASLSSSFSRSTSISGIDDKVRRGLKKRIARSWITWSESWCMRQWEEEEDERSRRISLGEPAVPLGEGGGNRRIKNNVRPTVRRIGELPLNTKKSGSTSKGGRAKSQPRSSSFQHLRTTSRRSERWMSLDNEVGEECGVEIQCTLSTTPRKTPPPMDAIEPKEDAPFDEQVKKPNQGGSTSTKVSTKNSKKRSFRRKSTSK